MRLSFVVSMLAVLNFSSVGCNSSSHGGTSFKGTIVQAATKTTNPLAHSIGQMLPGIEVCVLENCTNTNAEGAWYVSSSADREDEVLFSVKGHDAETTFVLSIPHKAKKIEIEAALHTGEGDHDNDHHDHDHHGHDHHGHDHKTSIKSGTLSLPSNQMITVTRVLIDGMDYMEAHDFYGDSGENQDNHQDHD